MNVWSFLTLEESARQFGGNQGYPDELGRFYSWDETVPNRNRVAEGDLAVLRDGSLVLGCGWIELIEHASQDKIRYRCPHCHRTDLKIRTTKMPPVRCASTGCAHEMEFEEREVEVLRAAKTYTAFYGSTWTPTSRPVSAKALDRAYMSRANQHAIRQMRLRELRAVLDGAVAISPTWWTQGPTFMRGGHRPQVVQARVGQAHFRTEMLGRFGSVCAITGPQPDVALEAAHLYLYADDPRHDPSGGCLLRRDLHALFDARLLAIDPETWTVRVSPSLQSFKEYGQLHEAPLRIPSSLRPNARYLSDHMARVIEKNGLLD